MSKKLLTIALVAVVLIAAGEAVWLVHSHVNNNQGTAAVQKYVDLNITLQNGKLASPPDTYLVKQGTNLQFTINSNVFGKIGAPISPPETITFTQSPLVFHFTASKVGSYPITYQAQGSTSAIQIGTVTVRANK